MTARFVLFPFLLTTIFALTGCEGDTTTINQPEPDLPSIVGAVSTSNYTVSVSFSALMDTSATDARNYSIEASNVNPEAAILTVVRAEFGESPDTVELTTMSQSEVEYELEVIGVHDQSGLPLAVHDAGTSGMLARFAGTGPTMADLVDTDGDGLTDNEEQIGWVVICQLSNGLEVVHDVTSDPTIADTDGDGLSDLDEQHHSTNPRDRDTDADTIEDAMELLYRSSALKQDTDGDGIDDATEILELKTSPAFSDTDGDQIPDGEEALLATRNPRIADLPRTRIRIGNVNLQLDTRFDYTQTDGTSATEEKVSSATLSQANPQTYSTSDSDVNISTYEVSNTLTVGATGDISGGFGGSIENALTIKAGLEQGHTSSFEEASTESAEQAYQESLTMSSTRDFSESVTRSIVDAAMLVDLSVANAGDIALTISNIELTAMAQDPNDRRRMIPIANLSSDAFALNLGALGGVSERGPIAFRTDRVFPSQIRANEESAGNDSAIGELRYPGWQSGRNFASTSQGVYDRTAGVIIDFGDGHIETHRIATNSTYDESGQPRGIDMAFALTDILGLEKDATDGYATEVVDRLINGEIQQVEILTRVRDRQTGVDLNPSDPIDESRTFWVVYSSSGLDPAINFDEIRVQAGDQFALTFVQDQDADEVFAREEELHGSSDLLPNTDGCPDDNPATPDYDGSCSREDYDTLGDKQEVKDGWIVRIRGNMVMNRRVYSDPRQPDSDGDGLMDDEEFACGTDPRQRDTDLDGLTDLAEIFGDYEIVDNDGFFVTSPPMYSGQVILDGGNRIADTAVDPLTDDELVVPTGSTVVFPGDIVVTGGPNGVIDTVPGGDDFIAAEHYATVACMPSGLSTAQFATDPLNPDTDFDGFGDGAERWLAINPNNPADGARFVDSDQDGVSDALEQDGFLTYVNTIEVRHYSNPDDADSDNDLLPDLLEHMLGSNPLEPDTDNDGLTDFDEYRDQNDCIGTGCQAGACVTVNAGAACVPGSFLRPVNGYQDFLDQCDAAPACNFSPDILVNFGSRRTGTNLNEKDTDFDLLADKIEVDGYTINGRLWAVPASSAERVYPDAFLPDTDGDGLFDNDEFETGTNPNDPDTDGDETEDNVEEGICPEPPATGACRNPTKADRMLKVRYTRIRIKGDCDTALPACGGTKGDWSWGMEFYKDFPNYDNNSRWPGLLQHFHDRSVNRLTDIDLTEGDSYPPELYVDTVTLFGEGRIAFAGVIWEDDPLIDRIDVAIKWAPPIVGLPSNHQIDARNEAFAEQPTVFDVDSDLADMELFWKKTNVPCGCGQKTTVTVNATIEVR